ncbi:hypothetical protein RN001_013399 [Aquatica leii]|uniref:Phospholipase A2-like domain-containing protein n=1 Tax=Aquatica leii TaxID=1421715 RepID=A0AAN7PQK3_9COLE|nr:hypothetical protein RN001_013399 [Aquatica leii]
MFSTNNFSFTRLVVTTLYMSIRSYNKSFKGFGLINTLVNKLPVELHLPGYNFCGPGTRLTKRLARGDKGINPLDEACREHDIAYSQTNDLSKRHEADRKLGSIAWQRFRSKDASFGEKAAALTISGVMKSKTKLGMGQKRKKKRGSISFKKAIQLARRTLGGKVQSDLKSTVKQAMKVLRQQKVSPPKQRIIPIPKTGGFLPLIPLFAALGAIGSLGGGAAAVAKAVNDAKTAAKTLEETKRHNQAMEAASVGKGLYLKPYKKGLGLYIHPYQKNSQ